MKICFSLLCIALLFSNGCMSIKDYSTLYFRNHKKIDGVESAADLTRRLAASKSEREILYGDNSRFSLLATCTVFRNQLFVAGMAAGGGEDGRKVSEMAKLMEVAYQTSMDDFLATCEREINTDVGSIFIQAQKVFAGAN